MDMVELFKTFQLKPFFSTLTGSFNLFIPKRVRSPLLAVIAPETFVHSIKH